MAATPIMAIADRRAPANEPESELDVPTLARARSGDRRACRALVRAYKHRVFALLSRMLGPSGRASLTEDLAQETFLRAFRGLAGFDDSGRARLSTWLLTIATRIAIDELRRPRRVVEPLDAEVVPSRDEADDLVEAVRIRRALEAAIGDLDEGHRAVFILREYHGLDYAEIAEAVEIHVDAVRSRLFRARRRLRAALHEVRQPEAGAR